MEKNINIDAIKLMRDIREKHKDEYQKNPELREKRLAEIRKKYKDRIKDKASL
ncbi:MAG: hypothetical protein RI564_00285 [Gracilimonas sp.]|jgi:hypothetical protein|nr:hypothetical protein [Gracilimonas sp.]